MPDGFLSAPELMEYVIGTCWGVDLSSENRAFEGFEISGESPLGRSAACGQLKTSARLIRDACISEALQAQVPIDPERPQSGMLRFTPADWRAASLLQAKTDLNTGCVFRWSSEPSAWANDKPLLFRADQCEAWLRSLSSPHVRSEVPSADPALLPERAYAMLCETVRWLSGQSVISKELLKDERMEMAARLHALADGRTAEIDKACPPGADFDADIWFAELLAVQPKIDLALKALTDAIVDGTLEARGQWARGKLIERELAAVDPDIFLTGVCLQYQDDQISADGSAEFERYVEARAAGYWREVRFRRNDLASLWGDAGKDIAEAATVNEVRAKRVTRTESDAKNGVRGRPNKGDAFALKYVELFPNGHEVDGLKWEEAIRSVCAQYGLPRVDIKTLTRALDRQK